MIFTTLWNIGAESKKGMGPGPGFSQSLRHTSLIPPLGPYLLKLPGSPQTVCPSEVQTFNDRKVVEHLASNGDYFSSFLIKKLS